MDSLLGFNLFKKNLTPHEIKILEMMQLYLTFLMPDSLDEAASIHPVPGYIDWRYVDPSDEPIVKLRHCIASVTKIAPKSKPMLIRLISIVNEYLTKPQRERIHAA
jgi:hypothetical protein